MAEFQSVQSSNIDAVAWDADAQELLVRFKNGSTYALPDAGEAAYQDLLTSESPGSYYARWLKNQHARRVS
jgi:hypothetical protein